MIHRRRIYRDLPRVAIHESGHTIFAAAYRHAVDRVSILPDAETRGHLVWNRRSGTPPRELAELDAMISLAGPLCEMRFCRGKPNPERWHGDFAGAFYAGIDVGLDVEAVAAWMNYLGCRVERGIDLWADEIQQLAELLLRHKTLEGRKLRALLHKIVPPSMRLRADQPYARPIEVAGDIPFAVMDRFLDARGLRV